MNMDEKYTSENFITDYKIFCNRTRINETQRNTKLSFNPF